MKKWQGVSRWVGYPDRPCKPDRRQADSKSWAAVRGGDSPKHDLSILVRKVSFRPQFGKCRPWWTSIRSCNEIPARGVEARVRLDFALHLRQSVN